MKISKIAAFLVSIRGTRDGQPVKPTPQDPSRAASSTESVTTRQLRESTGEELSDTAATESARMRRDWHELLSFLNGNPPPDAQEVRDKLLALRRRWAGFDPITAADTIAALLREADDARTVMRFQVGPHGRLEGWPTARVFLLDALVYSDPERAPVIAREVLAETASPSEFAVALRSLTRKSPYQATPGELQGYLSNALRRDDWFSDPGFAHSLDLARFIATPAASESILHWQGPARLKSAVLHEIAAESPERVVAAAARETGLATDLRGTLIARGDLADPAQASAVDAYLRETTDPAAIESFLQAFPLRSTTVGHRLYAPSPRPFTEDAIRVNDRIALQMTERWLADPAMAAHQSALSALRDRLTTWQEAETD